jgi:hypothetical protein
LAFHTKRRIELRIFDNKRFRTLFGLKKEEITGNWTKLHNEELHDLYASPNTILVMKSRRMRWTRHTAQVGKIRKRSHLEDLGIDRETILR